LFRAGGGILVVRDLLTGHPAVEVGDIIANRTIDNVLKTAAVRTNRIFLFMIFVQTISIM